MITLIQAIARMEGFGADPDNIPTRCNNPGDICAGQFANAHGALPGASDPKFPGSEPFRYAVFPNADAGWTCLRTLLTAHYVGLTLEQAIARYAPAVENDTTAYVRDVCAWTGLTPDTVLTAENIG